MKTEETIWTIIELKKIALMVIDSYHPETTIYGIEIIPIHSFVISLN